MDKLLEFGERFPQTGEPTVQLVAFQGHSGGMYIEKRAFAGNHSPLYDFLKTVQPEPGCTFLLVNALGAYEYYGDNRNGDAFPMRPYPPPQGAAVSCGHANCQPQEGGWVSEPETLTKHYQSFEKHGGIYKHHCFPAGTLITMGDRSRCPIEEIGVGDVVATHQGAFAVTQTWRKPFQGPGVQLRLRGQLEPLTATANHPLYVLRRAQVHCRHGYSRLTPSPHATCCLELREPVGNPEWVPAEEVLTGDYLLLRPPSLGTKEIDPAFAALVGWVASEGHLGANGVIQFTFGQDNLADQISVEGCFKELGVRVGRTPRPQYGTVMLSACSKELHHRLQQYIQGVLSEKRITGDVLSWNREALLRLLGAYIDGDGHVAKAGRNKGQLRIRSSSPHMLHALADVIRALGVPATLNWDTPPGEMVAPTNGRVYEHNGSGCVAVVTNHVPTLTPYSRKQTEHQTKGVERGFVYEGYHLCQVVERDDVLLDEDVFNLEVAGPHTFVANEVVVHNCNKDPAKSLGHIQKAVWNDRMKRAELLLKLVNSRDEQLSQRIGDGEFPAVSMGCHVRWDVCSICGHRAPTRKEYCEHALNLRYVWPDGRKNFVLNPSPKFFDISFVFRPADPTGWMLKKVADAEELVVPSAWLGEKVAEQNARVHELRSEQAKVAQALGGAYRKTAEYVIADWPALGPREKEVLAQAPLPVALSTLAAAGVLLGAREVSELFCKKAGLDPSAEELDRAAALQPLLDEVLVRYPDVGEKLGSLVALRLDAVRPELLAPIAPWVEKRGGLGDYMRQRAYAPGDLLPNLPVGPGALYRANEPPKTDRLTLTDPNTGAVYQTTRGAAMQAHQHDIKNRLATSALLSALYAGGLRAALGRRAGLWVAPAAIGAGILTEKKLRQTFRPYRHAYYRTDEGYPVSGGTEFAKVSGLDRPRSTDVLHKEAFDRRQRGESASPAPRPASLSHKVAALVQDAEVPGAETGDPPTLDLVTLVDALGRLIVD